MYTSVKSGALTGIESTLVTVEVDVSSGIPSFEIVGLPDASVRESKERIKTAINNNNFEFPLKKIIINLSPADIKKNGTNYDLPIAVSILSCMNVIKVKSLDEYFIAGELRLDGTICPIRGVLSMVLEARNNGCKNCIIPKENVNKAVLVKDINIFPCGDINEVIEVLNSQNIKPKEFDFDNVENELESYQCDIDFADVSGHESANVLW